MKEVVHPELQDTGPAEYSVKEIGQWLHDKQKNGTIEGYLILAYLRDNKMLEDCLSLLDLEAIQRKGILFFREHFSGKSVYGWKSVVIHHNGQLSAPYLIETNNWVVIVWNHLGDSFRSHSPALRFTGTMPATEPQSA